MPRPTAQILGTDTPNARRATRGKMMEFNDKFLFVADANLRRVPEYYVYIFNVSGLQHKIPRQWAHSHVIIPPCEPGAPYSKPFVIPDIVQDRNETPGSWTLNIRGVDGMFLAQDAINPGAIGGSWENYKPMDVGSAANEGTDLYSLGVWWTLDPEPAPDSEEVVTARERLDATYRRLVQEATEFSLQGLEGIKLITPLMHRAADHFQLKTAWHERLIAKVECEGCGEIIAAGVVRHMPKDKCGYVRNWEAALRSGMATREEAIAAGVLVATEPDPAPAPEDGAEETEAPAPKAKPKGRKS